MWIEIIKREYIIGFFSFLLRNQICVSDSARTSHIKLELVRPIPMVTAKNNNKTSHLNDLISKPTTTTKRPRDGWVLLVPSFLLAERSMCAMVL